MATVVLAVGTTSASSPDATAAAGDRVTIMLTSAQAQPLRVRECACSSSVLTTPTPLSMICKALTN